MAEFIQVEINADADHDDHQEDLGEEGLEALGSHPDFVRNDAQGSQDDHEDDHVGQAVDGEAEDGGKEVVAEDGSDDIRSQGDQEAGSDFFDFGKNSFFFFLVLVSQLGATNQGGAVSGPGRFLVTQTIEEGCGNNGVDVADGQDNDGKVVVIDGLIAGNPLIDLGQGNSTAAVASAHDGKDIVGDDPAGGNPED